MILRRTLKQRLAKFFSNNRHCDPAEGGGSNLLSRRFIMSPIKSFNLSFSLSLFLHILILSCLSIFSQTAKPQPIKTVQVNYIKIQPKKLNATNKANKTTGNIQRKDLDLSRLSLEQQIILSKEDKLPQHKELPKPTFSKIDFVSKEAIKLSSVEIEAPDKLSRTPVYLTYSSLLREKIRRCLYGKFSEISDKGLVCLRFSLDAAGGLQEYRIVEEKSNASQELKDMAISGLKDASPFPPLPKELNSTSAAFNVVIHFIEEKE